MGQEDEGSFYLHHNRSYLEAVKQLPQLQTWHHRWPEMQIQPKKEQMIGYRKTERNLDEEVWSNLSGCNGEYTFLPVILCIINIYPCTTLLPYTLYVRPTSTNNQPNLVTRT